MLKIFKGQIDEDVVNAFIADKKVISTNVIQNNMDNDYDVQVFVWYEELTAQERMFRGLQV